MLKVSSIWHLRTTLPHTLKIELLLRVIVKICYKSTVLLYLVLAQDAIQAALNDYKSKNDSEEGGPAQGQAQSSAV